MPNYIKVDLLEKPIDNNLNLLFNQLRLDTNEGGDNSNTVEIEENNLVDISSGYDSINVLKGLILIIVKNHLIL